MNQHVSSVGGGTAGQRTSMLRLQRFVRSSMWLLPIGCLVAGVLLAVGALAVDRATDYGLVPLSVTGTPSDAQTILSSLPPRWCR